MPDYGPVLNAAFRLCLGGNVFGWTISEDESFEVLDAYAAAGGNFIDTSDVYSAWKDGNSGGESETIIGNWMRARGNRDQILVATKVGQLGGVSGAAIRTAAEDSLRRLQVDHIDLYYTHIDDPEVPLEDTLGALDALKQAGTVREIAASGYTAERLAEALAVSDREGLARYRAVQPLYNLLERDAFEGGLQELCAQEGLACIPFFSLARGFLTGKYRPGQETESKRGEFAWGGEWDDRSRGLIEALDEVAAAHDASLGAVSLAWLRAQPTVLAPIASARTADQLKDIIGMATLELSADELERLTNAGALPAGA